MRCAVLRKLLYISGRSISSMKIVGTAGLLLLTVNPGSVASTYIDLRRIEPITGDAETGAKKAMVCQACHGANGAPVAPTFPRLAGQRRDYLYHRLVSFKRASPKDPYYSQSPMTPNVAGLSDSDMRDLAAYFAAQAPLVSATAPSTEGNGEALFVAGDPARGIPPCQGCHGSDANGSPSRDRQYSAYPALRGQYATYITARLRSFRSGLPHGTTNDFVMNGVAQALDDQSIEAIAAWLSSLTPPKSFRSPDRHAAAIIGITHDTHYPLASGENKRLDRRPMQ
jgi:cytochrome c553